VSNYNPVGYILANQHAAKLIACLFACFCLAIQLVSAQNPMAQNGFIDLSNWDYQKNEVILLNGSWKFYWRKTKDNLKDSAQVYKHTFQIVPNSWDNYKIQDQQIPKFGFSTYQVGLIIPEKLKGKLLALKIKSLFCAYNLYFDDKLTHQVGKFHPEEQQYIPQLNPAIIEFIPNKDTVYLTIEVANYSDRFAGITDPIELSQAAVLRTRTEFQNYFSFALLGSFLFMGLYHIGLYYFRRKKLNLATLFFAGFCLLIALRILVTDEYLLVDIFPNLSFEFVNKLSYLTFSLAVLALGSFLKSLYPGDYSNLVFKLILWVTLAYSALIIVFKAPTYSLFLLYFQLFTLIFGIFYGIIFSALILIRKRAGAIIFVVGVLVLFTTAINDILAANKVINSTSIAPIGLFTFFFSQTILLSSRFSKAFSQVEELSEKLTDLNKNLEETVKERTLELEQTNEELQTAYEDSKATLKLVNQQKVALEEKDKNLTDSLQYAQRIQTALLPDLEKLSAHFQDFFVLNLPRDIVSGDFYYFKDLDDRQILAAVDCTGHGVPGALMSMIGYQLLEQIVSRNRQIHADEILFRLNFGIQQVLKQQETHSNDGMDLALVILDKAQKKLEFAGAKNPIIYIQYGKLHFIKGDTMPVGGDQYKQIVNYTLHTIDVSTPTSFYLFSDGYQDQFGGPLRKKFLIARLRELLYEISGKPMLAQKEILYRTLREWISNGMEKQIDDVLILGAKVEI